MELEWYWYWIIFLGGSSVFFYTAFFLVPQQWAQRAAQKTQEDEDVVAQMKEEELMNCPICKLPMSKDSLNGIIVDRCLSHGVWLDKGELEVMVNFLKSGGDAEGFLSNLQE